MLKRKEHGRTMLTKADYKGAILVQDACNLSGIVQSWAKMMEKIWDEARAHGEGTSYVNGHPINVMFASKVASLTGSEESLQFSAAYEACQKELE